jgi:hypothetical protein
LNFSFFIILITPKGYQVISSIKKLSKSCCVTTHFRGRYKSSNQQVVYLLDFSVTTSPSFPSRINSPGTVQYRAVSTHYPVQCHFCLHLSCLLVQHSEKKNAAVAFSPSLLPISFVFYNPHFERTSNSSIQSVHYSLHTSLTLSSIIRSLYFIFISCSP